MKSMGPRLPSPVRFLAALAAVCGALSATIAGCGSDNSIVGGSCAPAYTQCSLFCIDTQNDPNNCGGCGHLCAAGSLCASGVCGSSHFDGSADDASDAPYDGNLGDGRFREGGTDDSDGSPPDAVPADVVTVDACMPPYTTAQHCGDCFTSCSGVNDTCLQRDGGAFECAPLCTLPLNECNNQCVDQKQDPFNCGTCGKICPSNLCAGGLCQGATPGDTVVIGHDYLTTLPGNSQARALSNAVFLPTSNPLRILSFEHYADPLAVARVKAILQSAAQAQGRTLNLAVSMVDADIPNNLTIQSYDTLLVYDQALATSGTLGTMGTLWSPKVTTFLKSGGNIVALDGAAGATNEMPQLETNAGILAVTSHASLVPGTPVMVVAPLDSIAVGVLSPYGVGKDSARFVSTELNGGNVGYVVLDPTSSQPVIVHKIIP